MSQASFTVIINLSNFLNDHRHRARIFVNERIKTIKDLQDKIVDIFGVKNFYLISQNEYLPPSEDVRILRSDDLVWVMPSAASPQNGVSEKSINEEHCPLKPQRKRKSSPAKSSLETFSRENNSPLPYELDNHSSKKKKKKHRVDDEVEEAPKVEKAKKHKKKSKDIDTNAENAEEALSTYSKKRLASEENKHSSKDFQKPENVPSKKIKKSKDFEFSSKNLEPTKVSSKKIDKPQGNFSVKNIPKSPKSNSFNETPSVNVGTSLPNSIFYKKITVIPTITEEYLKEKKINIVKIDYINKPTVQPNQEEKSENVFTIEARQVNSAVELPTESMSSVSLWDKKDIIQPAIPILCNNNNNNEKVASNLAHSETLLVKKSNKIDNQQTSKMSLISPPKTKYFFFNTPSSKKLSEKAEVVKPKKENLFRLDKYKSLFSPVTKNDSVSQDNLKSGHAPENTVPMDVDSKEEDAVVTEKVQDASEPAENPEVSRATSNAASRNNLHTESEANGTEPKIDFSVLSKQQITAIVRNRFDTWLKSNQSIGEASQSAVKSTNNLDLDATEISENALETIKDRPSSMLTNFAEKNSPDVHNRQIIEETKLCDATTELEPGVVEDADLQLRNSNEANGPTEDSCYINKISPCDGIISDSIESVGSDLGISGLNRISCWGSKRKISGVGELLGSIRKSDSTVFETTANSSNTEFVTTRKRNRVRKRQKKKSNQDSTTEETARSGQHTAASVTPKPMKTAAAPKMHLKFSDNEDDGKNEDTKETADNDEHADSIISIGSDPEEMTILEENILKSPSMAEMVPKIGDIIAFKVLKISNQFTPELSSYVLGHVRYYCSESKLITFEITSGLEELQTPNGKLSLDEEDDSSHSSKFKEILWADLIEPRLLYP